MDNQMNGKMISKRAKPSISRSLLHPSNLLILLYVFLVAYFIGSEFIIKSGLPAISQSILDDASMVGGNVRSAINDILRCYQDYPKPMTLGNRERPDSAAQNILAANATILAIMVWTAPDTLPSNRVVINRWSRDSIRYNPTLSVTKLEFQPFFSEFTNLDTTQIDITAPSEFNNGFMNAFDVIHAKDPQASSAQLGTIYCSIFIYDSSSGVIWKLLNLGLMAAILIFIRMIYQSDWASAPRYLKAFRWLVIILSITYSMLTIPWLLASFGLVKLSLSIQPLLSIFYYLEPDPIILMLIFWFSAFPNKKLPFLRFALPLIVIHYGVSSANIIYHFETLIGVASRFGSNINQIFRSELPQIWCALTITAAGIGFLISRKGRLESKISGETPESRFIYILTLMLILWGVTQVPFFAWDQTTFYGIIFATKAMALVCVVIYAYQERISREHYNILIQEKRHRKEVLEAERHEHQNILAQEKRHKEEILKEVEKRRMQLFDVLSKYNLIFLVIDDNKLQCASEDTCNALGLDKERQFFTLEDIVHNKSGQNWMSGSVLTRQLPLLGFALTLKGKGSNPLICEADYLPPGGEAMPNGLIIARPLELMLFRSLHRTLTAHEEVNLLEAARGRLDILVDRLLESGHKSIAEDDRVLDIYNILQKLLEDRGQSHKWGDKITDLDLTDCDLKVVFERLREKVKREHLDKIYKINFPDIANDLKIRAHSEILVDILFEPIANALKKMRETHIGNNVNLKIDSATTTDYVIITIENDGPRIEEENIAPYTDKQRLTPIPREPRMGFALMAVLMRLSGGLFEPMNVSVPDSEAKVPCIKLTFWKTGEQICQSNT